MNSDELEFLAEFQALDDLEVDLEVGMGGILVGAGAPLGRKMNAVSTSEAQLEARGLLTKPQIDESTHARYWKGWDGCPR